MMKMKSISRQWKSQEKEKKGVDEAEVEQRKYRARNFVSDKAEP